MSDVTANQVIGIIGRYKDEPVAPLSALGADPEEIRALLGGECVRRLVDPGAPDAWRTQHKPREPLPDFEREPKRAWRARRSLAEGALVELSKFVPDVDARLVRYFLDAERGRAAQLGGAEQDRARSIVARIDHERAEARRRNRDRRRNHRSVDFDPMIILMLVFVLPVVVVSAFIGAWVGDSIGVYLLGGRWLIPLIVVCGFVGMVAPILYLGLLGRDRDWRARKVHEREGEPHEPL
jgi:hypothetical protein